jgi:hypothetical protein
MKIIKPKYLKRYMSTYLWRLQNSVRMDQDYPDYSPIIFKAELDNALSAMEKELTAESDRTEVKEALRYILNARPFDYLRFLKESARIIFNSQDEARGLCLYMWKFLFDGNWEYPEGVSTANFKFKDEKTQKETISDVITQKKWHDNKDFINWDTQIFFGKDGTGTLGYLHQDDGNQIYLRFRYQIRENDYTDSSVILIHFPDINVAFELVVKVMKAMSLMRQNGNGRPAILKLSDNPFFLTQDYLNRKNHNPKETFFYQIH